MGVNVAEKILSVSDIHTEFFRSDLSGDIEEPYLSPLQTIDRILTDTESDLLVNLGDNSGISANYVLRSAMDNGHNKYVSVLGNHDVEEIDLNIPTSRKNSFFTYDMSKKEISTSYLSGYGIFGEEADSEFRSVSDFRMYYKSVSLEESNVGFIFRHFPFYFERGREKRYLLDLVNSEDLDIFYIISGHLHKDKLRVDLKGEDYLGSIAKGAPVVNVVLPPFTKSKRGTRGNMEWYAGFYEISLLEDGSLSLDQIYLDGDDLEEEPVGGFSEDLLGVSTLESEIKRGTLLGKS